MENLENEELVELYNIINNFIKYLDESKVEQD